MKSFKKLLGSKKGSEDPVKESSKGNSKSKEPVLTEPLLPAGFYGAFPSAFGIYLTQRSPNQKKGQDCFSICPTAVAGPQQQPQPPSNVFAVHKGMVKHHVTLYSTDRYDSPPLALGGIDKFFTGAMVVALPGLADAVEPKNEIITLKDHKKWMAPIYSFSLTIGDKLESFEWRGDDARKSKKDVPHEWKLFRVASPQGAEEMVGLFRDAPEQAMAAGSMGSFELQGSGATGELGQYWTLLTVSSFLKIFQTQWEARAAADKMIKAVPELLGAGLGFGLGA